MVALSMLGHCAAIALYFMHYKYARVHQSLRITPAMATSVSDHVWKLEDRGDRRAA